MDDEIALLLCMNEFRDGEAAMENLRAPGDVRNDAVLSVSETPPETMRGLTVVDGMADVEAFLLLVVVSGVVSVSTDPTSMLLPLLLLLLLLGVLLITLSPPQK
eukprot:TRINITY_DN4182_c0_g2_i1.p2 TRINITY_DN4182_c0_g2~~TRINITY_DN4182_c0_g2_i1.p2  ORF type:complete len:104 (+),score=23.21 TRINITY_DN4182_c0_g2_i1:234-545(+)